MVFSKASQIPTCNINVHGKILEQVHSFVYLGGQFTSDARCEKEIRIKEDWDREVCFYIHEQSVDIKGYTYDSLHQSAEMLCVVNSQARR